jgi:molecular chaperone GrpE
MPLVTRLKQFWLTRGLFRKPQRPIPSPHPYPTTEGPAHQPATENPAQRSEAFTRALAPVLARLEAIEQHLARVELTPPPTPTPATSTPADQSQLQESIAALQKQISRAGREQLKANTLVEAQIEQFREALDMVQAAEKQHEQKVLELHAQIQRAQQDARLDIARKFLPVLDRLDEALRSGRALLEQAHDPDQPETEPPRPEPSFWQRLFGTQPPAPTSSPAPQPEALSDAMASWLEGLTYITQRMLDILATEQITPMETEGHPFDPQHHVALEVVAATPETPDGTVAAELRRGYRHGERVLRHAEVMVARAPPLPEPDGATMPTQEPETEAEEPIVLSNRRESSL